jgi:cytochrome P450
MSQPSVATDATLRTDRRAKPPGPPAYAALRTLRAIERDPLSFLQSTRARYGDIARSRFFFWEVYQLSHPDYVKHVLQDRHTIYTKQTFDYRMLKPLVGDGLLTSDGAFWLRQRRLMQPAFHRARIAAFVGMMVGRARGMAERWAVVADRGEALDIVPEMSRLAMEVVTRALFNTEIDTAAGRVSDAATTLNRYVSEHATSLLFLLTPESFRGNRGARAAIRTLNEVVDEIIAEHRRRGEDRGDLLSMLLLARDEETGEAMSDQQIRHEVLTLLVAGHETTANALSWTWYLLSQHQEIGEKLRAELAGVLAGREPTIDDLPQLTYTRMVLDESMRLYPPVWATSRAPAEEDEIAGYRIRPKSVVLLSPYVTHRHPDFWERPDTFDPERFTPERAAERPRFAYFPFGGGPRLCIGNTFALTEATLVLAVIAQRFQLDLVPGHPVVPEPLVTLRPRFGLRMRLRGI